jgi:hypothetical protein
VRFISQKFCALFIGPENDAEVAKIDAFDLGKV